MFGRGFRIFSLFGFEVRLDLTWLILGALITWSLATGLFPFFYEGLTPGTYWLMGVAGALGLLFSIVFHELSHSLIARRYGLPIKGITLFVFGGVAEMEDEPPTAKAEFLMAVAGPIASVILAVVLYGIYQLGADIEWQAPVNGVIYYLALINALLAAFNLLPAFPLDGGRMLRAGLWSWKDNFRSATRTAARIGAGFGIVLIILGIFSFLQGNFIGGMWWFLIGLFLRSAAHMSYRQVLMRQALEGEPVKRFMNSNPVTVPPSISLEEFVENYAYKYHFDSFPVVDNSQLKGWISTREVKEVSRGDWPKQTVGSVSRPPSADNTVPPHCDSMKALSLMNRTNSSRLMVVEKDRVVGILTLKDLLKFLSMKVDLEEEAAT